MVSLKLLLQTSRVSRLGKDEKLRVWRLPFMPWFLSQLGFMLLTKKSLTAGSSQKIRMIKLEKKEEAKWKPKDIKRSPSTATIFDDGETFDGGTTFDGGEATETGFVLVVVESRWRKKEVYVDWSGSKRKKKSQFSALDVNS